MSSTGTIYAQELIKQLGITGPFDIRDAAAQLGLEIQEEDVDGFEGALVRIKNQPFGIIVIDRNIPETGRKRFTIAHEVGHFVIPYHGQIGAICGTEFVENWSKRLSPSEEEANQFAGEFLIPSAFVRNEVLEQPPSFEGVRWIADTFQASLTASAYRLMDLTSHAAIVVRSTRKRIEWFKRSTEFDVFVRVDEEVQEGSCAFDIYHGTSVSNHYERVPAKLWLSARGIRDDATILEHSLFLPRYESVLTLLYIDKPIDEPEAGPLDEMEPDEFTIWRKRWPGKRRR